MKKLTFFLLLLLSFNAFAGDPGESRAKGYFFALGVGPRVPFGNFSSKTIMGYGFNAELSYVDNKIMPYFIFGRIGFEQFPGSQDFYQDTEYSHYSMQYLPLSVGVRHYFPPILKNVFLLTPIAEVSGSMVIFQELHDFKQGINKNGYIEDGVRFGGSAGFGVSAFVLEAMASYNIYNDSHFISFDLRVRLPLFVSF
ncbi:MAG: hypothetical protein LCH52_04430 [Bacteroidetes bacterium]|nr:hypothetical protein [Bacteroidota bacterium]